jgi:ABC-type sugar transport system substrate-binding protein
MNQVNIRLLNKSLIFIVSLIFIISPLSADMIKKGLKPLKIALFYSNPQGFWPMAEAFASATATDLNIEFNSYCYYSSPVKFIEIVKKILNNPKTRPDGFLFHNYKRRGKIILEIANELKIPSVIFNSGPTIEDNIGLPKEKYPYYFGMITPDDENAGYNLAIELISIARKKNFVSKDGKIHMCVLEGSKSSNAALSRKKGLIKALKENKDVVVDQFFDTKWDKKNAEFAFELANLRYKKAKVFWAASDHMSLGIIESSKKLNKIPGKDFIVGSIDLLPSIQSEVLNGNISLSLGAHYTESVWAMILLSDQIRGCYKNEINSHIYKSTMMKLHTSDKPILPGSTKKDVIKWANKIDFSQYSKCFSETNYNFNASILFNQR